MLVWGEAQECRCRLDLGTAEGVDDREFLGPGARVAAAFPEGQSRGELDAPQGSLSESPGKL